MVLCVFCGGGVVILEIDIKVELIDVFDKVKFCVDSIVIFFVGMELVNVF